MKISVQISDNFISIRIIISLFKFDFSCTEFKYCCKIRNNSTSMFKFLFEVRYKWFQIMTNTDLCLLIICFLHLFIFCHSVSSEGTVTYSKVVTFLNQQQTVTIDYKSIGTALNKTITLSGSHLIFSRKSVTEDFNPM